MRSIGVVLVTLMAIICGSCSSTVDVAPVTETQGLLDGIPFRIRKPTTIEIYSVGDVVKDGNRSVKLLQKAERVIADQEQLYLLRYEGAWLSNGTLIVEYAPDGGLKKVAMTEESQAAAGLKEAGTQITAVETVRRAEELRKSEAESKEETAATSELDAELAYNEAEIDVAKKQAALEAAEDEEGRAGANLELKLAQIRANDKRKRLGLPPVYDVTP